MKIYLSKNISDYTGRTSVRYGVLIGMALIAYFWIAYFFNFIHVPVMRLFNLVIQMGGMYMACRELRRIQGGSLNYFRAQVACFGTSAVASILFSVFLFVLFALSDTVFNHVASGIALGKYLNAFTVSFAVFVECVASGMIGAIIVVNAIKTDPV
jgi:hypothetical protein